MRFTPCMPGLGQGININIGRQLLLYFVFNLASPPASPAPLRSGSGRGRRSFAISLLSEKEVIKMGRKTGARSLESKR